MDNVQRFLYALWAERRIGGPRVVLSGIQETPDATPERVAYAQELGGEILIPQGGNTFDEAEYTISRFNGDQLTLVTSDYHVPRAYLTFLQALRRRGKAEDVQLWARGCVSDLTKLPIELEKIALYQKRQHVATYEDGLEHLQRVAAL